MVDALAGHGLDAETAKLDEFYASVRKRAQAIQTAAGRQTIIHELYEDFFKKAFPKQASSFGVVYTPVEIVDFILRAADDVCRDKFGYGLTDQGVHILDPFTGTGTFITRLLESGIIRSQDLARKYSSELWANEVMLLAYYIACVNIETTYQAIAQAQHPDQDVVYQPFAGATLTDTFQITEDGDRADSSLIPVNNDRIEAQLAAPIKVIVANPPYSTGQSSANDDNANLKYPTLDARIGETYAARSTATNKNSLYDSYIRAFRWASDRLGDQGVIGFVSNNGWVDGNTADGIRKSFADEFNEIWIYNLRGNQRTQGETSRREGGKVFGSGARIGVAVLVAAKRASDSEPCVIHYSGVPDYQTQEQKLEGLEGANLTNVAWAQLNPNQAGDWLNQRNESFGTFPAIVDAQPAHFVSHSAGVQTNRDAWCYNFSAATVKSNMKRMIAFYNAEAEASRDSEAQLNLDPKQISWSRNIKRRAIRGTRADYSPRSLRSEVMYRPFCKQAAYLDPVFNSVPGQGAEYFPSEGRSNIAMYLPAPGSSAPPFMCLATNAPIDLGACGISAAKLFPHWTYNRAAAGTLQDTLVDTGGVNQSGYSRVDNTPDAMLTIYRDAFGPSVGKDDVFFYVYGVLHSEQYRTTFAADLKRMLPRIPLAASRADFESFAGAGRRLADLHIGYETVEPYPLHEQSPLGMDPWEAFRVTKMRWADKTRKTLVYNAHVNLGDVPAAAHRYMLGSRSALDWLVDRYQLKTDKASGIVNDPNDWGREHDDPRYIVDLVKGVTRVSIDTMSIVDGLPELPI